MRVNIGLLAGVPASTMAALMLAVFTVSVGFGVVLPLLPHLIERLLGAGVRVIRTDEEVMIAKSVCRVLGLLIEKENEHGHEDEKT